MTLADDVNLEEFVMTKDEFSGADIKAICTEAGLLALRERRMKVSHILISWTFVSESIWISLGQDLDCSSNRSLVKLKSHTLTCSAWIEKDLDKNTSFSFLGALRYGSFIPLPNWAAVSDGICMTSLWQWACSFIWDIVKPSSKNLLALLSTTLLTSRSRLAVLYPIASSGEAC